ncbi:unnamed protein product, partial [Scytosiphon promiscuus]
VFVYVCPFVSCHGLCPIFFASLVRMACGCKVACPALFQRQQFLFLEYARNERFVLHFVWPSWFRPPGISCLRMASRHESRRRRWNRSRVETGNNTAYLSADDADHDSKHFWLRRLFV